MTTRAGRGQRRQLGPVFIAVLLIVIAATHALAAPTSVAADRKPMEVVNLRCLRPFSSVEKFADVAKTPKEQNCDFHFFSATSASVKLLCDGVPAASAAADSGSADLEGCNVTVTIDLSVPADVSDRLERRTGDADEAKSTGRVYSRRVGSGGGVLFDQDDLWRYELELAATQEGTRVRYKGFAGEGYSLCCDGMVTGAANCPWMTQDAGDNDLAEEDEAGVEERSQQRRLLTCPLPLPSARRSIGRAGLEKAFQVQVTKPLPNVIEGPWEARVDFSRKRLEGEREVLGRVVVSFDVQPSLLWAGGHVVPVQAAKEGADHPNRGAAVEAGESLVVVDRVPVPATEGEPQDAPDAEAEL